ncbi:ubiquitin-like domain-containing protein stuxnet [Rhipicephalus microplus]|uniref:ubiquitin-like domain-containing protein stuxnet n=1 Tax=Rhipicephalus microplus TaxID=6941 RepID=UPI003F6B7E25
MSTEGGESSSRITISVHTTTGGRMQLQLQPQCTVAALKKTLSARLRLAKDRMVLLHRNRQLKEGTLDSNNVRDGERLTLLPSVETGLQAIKPEQSVMQALESLTDAQVENFLCGRAPLHLTMRLGDHVMFVQLQLCPPVETPPATPTSPNCPAPPAAVAPPPEAAPSSGAVIDQLRHLGQGVYSGSFSGTLGPELQDGEGRPRRHVATILHILRDLLGASQGWRGPLTPTSASARSPTAPSAPASDNGGTLGGVAAGAQHPSSSSASGSEVMGGDATPPTSPCLRDATSLHQEEHRVLRGKLDQIRATLRERRRARRRASPYPTTSTASTPAASSDEPVLV